MTSLWTWKVRLTYKVGAQKRTATTRVESATIDYAVDEAKRILGITERIISADVTQEGMSRSL